MTDALLSTSEAASRLGLSTATMYDWLSQSDNGTFQLRGQSTTIKYFQGGRKGQGRIKIPANEVTRLLSMMAVQPRSTPARLPPRPRKTMQHVTTQLGRPKD